MDMVNKFVDSVQGVPVLGPLAVSGVDDFLLGTRYIRTYNYCVRSAICICFIQNAAKAFPQMIVDMALREFYLLSSLLRTKFLSFFFFANRRGPRLGIASTFIGQSGLIATIPGAAQFVVRISMFPSIYSKENVVKSQEIV